MSFLSYHYGLMSSEDQATSPQIRNIDISQSFQGLHSNNENTKKVVLQPAESQTIAVTLRTLSSDTSTHFAFERPIDTDATMRFGWTGAGAAPNFRTARALSLSPSTSVSISRIGPNAARLTMIGINASSVSNGDILKFYRNTDAFTSPFSSSNVGQSFTVQAVGSNYVDFIDNGSAALDTNILLADQAFAIMSTGPVRVGDTLLLKGNFNGANFGEFPIVDVAPGYIEYLNPYGVEETFTNTTAQTVRVYNYLINFLHISATDNLLVGFDGQAPIKVVPLGKYNPVVFCGTVCTYQIDVTNPGTEPVSVTFRHMNVDA